MFTQNEICLKNSCDIFYLENWIKDYNLLIIYIDWYAINSYWRYKNNKLLKVILLLYLNAFLSI